MPDLRSPLERTLWDRIGPPLYYCSECLRAVEVKAKEGQEPEIKRPCVECKDAQVFAPRKAILVGKGGMSMTTRAKVAGMQLASLVTGRTVG